MTSSGPSWCRRNRRPLIGCAALSPLTVLTILVMGSLASTPSAPDQPQPHQESPIARALAIRDGHFQAAGGSAPVLLVGANVVMKAAPWLPDATGDSSCAAPPHCDDMQGCTITCTTFNDADATNLKSQGYNHIRLGTVWAGAQQGETGRGFRGVT
jgi:hypothetical protein